MLATYYRTVARKPAFALRSSRTSVEEMLMMLSHPGDRRPAASDKQAIFRPVCSIESQTLMQ
jgi:hypothetical protein